MRNLGEKALRLPKTVSELPPRKQAQRITGVPFQITRSPQAHGTQKEQGQQRLAAGGGCRVSQPMSRLIATGQGILQGREQTGFSGCCQQQQAACALLPAWLRRERGLIFFPRLPGVGSIPGSRGPD